MGKGNLSTAHKWVLALLVLVPLAIILLKWGRLPTADFLQAHVSLTDMPAKLHRRLFYVLFVPMGAILVVLCRLTLGIRVLGPFRSILLGVAFQFTGVVLGLVFLSVVVASIVFVRPVLKAMKLPYFGRVSVLLSLVCVLIIATMMLGDWTGFDTLITAARFPIIVLCLLGDGFTKTVNREGYRSALWRGATTAVVAMVLFYLSQLHWLRQLLLHYPEILLAQIGGIMIISEYFDFRLLAWMNPTPVEGVGEDDDDTSEDAPLVLRQGTLTRRSEETVCRSQVG